MFRFAFTTRAKGATTCRLPVEFRRLLSPLSRRHPRCPVSPSELRKLQGLDGKAFEESFVPFFIAGHKAAITATEGVTTSSQPADVVSYSKVVLPSRSSNGTSATSSWTQRAPDGQQQATLPAPVMSQDRAKRLGDQSPRSRPNLPATSLVAARAHRVARSRPRRILRLRA